MTTMTEYKCWCGAPLTERQHKFASATIELAQHLTYITNCEWGVAGKECGEIAGVKCLIYNPFTYGFTRTEFERVIEESRDQFAPGTSDERIYALFATLTILGFEYNKHLTHEEIFDDTVVH